MNSNSKAAILLVNLGTPAAPTVAAVRRFLADFLGDPRVVEFPRWIWLPILYGVILRLRPRRSLEAYEKVWTAKGSPLMVYSKALAEKLGASLSKTIDARVELAMTYGEPSIGGVIARLHADGIRRLLVVPLYPQYSATSTGAVIDAAAASLRKQRWPLDLRVIGDYHADGAYISALAQSIEAHWQQQGRAERLLLSFHGIPQQCIESGDPYFEQCSTTARLLRERLGVSADFLVVSFQSRVGSQRWVEPYTDVLLEQLARDGTRRLQVLCPGFAVDCLETLEEIAIRGREQFLHAGGETLEYIPALNESDAHVEVMRSLVLHHTQGWPEFQSGNDRAGA